MRRFEVKIFTFMKEESTTLEDVNRIFAYDYLFSRLHKETYSNMPMGRLKTG